MLFSLYSWIPGHLTLFLPLILWALWDFGLKGDFRLKDINDTKCPDGINNFWFLRTSTYLHSTAVQKAKCKECFTSNKDMLYLCIVLPSGESQVIIIKKKALVKTST